MFIPFWQTNTKTLLQQPGKADDEQVDFVLKVSELLADIKSDGELDKKAKVAEASANLQNMRARRIDMELLPFLQQIVLLANIMDLVLVGFDFLDDRGEMISKCDAMILQKLSGRRPNYNMSISRSFSSLARFLVKHHERPDWLHFECYSLFPPNYVFNCGYKIQKMRGDCAPVFASKMVMQALVQNRLIRGIVLDDVLGLLQQDRFFEYFFVLSSNGMYYSTETYFLQNVDKIDINDLNLELRRGLAERNYNFTVHIGDDELEQLGLTKPITIALIEEIGSSNRQISSLFASYCRHFEKSMADTFPFSFDYTLEVPEPTEVLSIFDSITKQRLETPARTTECSHLQAFEKSTYMTSCPICAKSGRLFECALYRHFLTECGPKTRFLTVDAELHVLDREDAPDDELSGWEL